MKKINNINPEARAKAKGRKVSAIIHAVFLGLLVFPFLQMAAPDRPQDVQIVMDFSSGSSAEGAKTAKKATITPKAIEKPKPQKAKPVITAEAEEKVVIKEEATIDTEEIAEAKSEPAEKATAASIDASEPSNESGTGAGDEGKGDAAEGSAENGNGRGFIEGSGSLTRVVIDRGNTKALAQQNGTLILKICINRRGIVTFAEWDKVASSIKDSKIARTALDNVLKYRFETDRGAPSKECGRLTYIINVD